jgi:nitronate monooxygenase
MRALERPFWMAGSYGSPERVLDALDQGAAGVQVGTAFAFCKESGLRDDLKRRILEMSRAGVVDVLTDPAASPTGFPFKVLQLEGSLSEDDVYAKRERQCDLGFLRQMFRRPDGTLGGRCPAENVTTYVRKGGDPDDVNGRKCICNALMANVGLAQVRRGGQEELPLVTCGEEVRGIASFARSDEAQAYTARDVISHLLSSVKAPLPC